MRGLIPFNKNSSNALLERSSPWHNFQNMLDAFFNEDAFFMRSLNQHFKLDVLNSEKEYLVQADLPGIKKEDVKLDYTDGALTISVTKEANKEVSKEKEQYIHRERSISSMIRTVYLDNVEIDGIKAKLEEGVLTITLPKSTGHNSQKYITVE